MLDALGGLKVENSGMQAFATNGRAPVGTCPLCRTIVSDTLDPAVVTANARQACYVDVFIDGVAAYQAGMEPPELPYDLNSILPDGIEGFEFYSGAAQVPPKYTSRFGAGCGVLLFWTRLQPEKKPQGPSSRRGSDGGLVATSLPLAAPSLMDHRRALISGHRPSIFRDCSVPP